MSALPIFSGKSTPTFVARVWPVVGVVRVDMVVAMRHLFEGRIAYVALVRLFTGVNSPMGDERRRLSKLLSAIFADVTLIARRQAEAITT